MCYGTTGGLYTGDMNATGSEKGSLRGALHSFTPLFVYPLFMEYHVPGTGLPSGETAVNETDTVSVFMEGSR